MAEQHLDHFKVPAGHVRMPRPPRGWIRVEAQLPDALPHAHPHLATLMS